MASIIEEYNYDIFVSYRQKDNKYDGWVTEFVDNLKKELAATFKEEISLYFDINPHDGLLETHDVDESLKEKLKCLVFIPIISRTYCDPGSFAWEHEFKAFIDHASGDQFGLKVKLPNGNVAGRVLPVQIHELDIDDKKRLEDQLGGFIRGIEFIYKEPGVNKPLTKDDDEKKNLNNTKYRIQINKTANAIKEVISGLRSEPVLIDKKRGEDKEILGEKKKEVRTIKLISTKKIIPIVSIILIAITIYLLVNASRSIPFSEKDWILISDFENLTGDDIFNQSLNTALEISVQQSSFVNVFPGARVNETLKRMGKDSIKIINEDTAIEIAQREGIAVIIVCNINRIGDTYLLTSKVVEVETGKILRTETFQANGKNEILTSLDNMAREIRKDLGESLREINSKVVALPEATTSSLEALKCLSRGLVAWTTDGQYNEAEALFLKAIELDPEFALAYAVLGSLNYWRNNQLKGEENFNKALSLSDRLTEKERLMIEARVEEFRGNFEGAILKYNIYLRSYPGSPGAWFALGYCYMMSGQPEEAIAAFDRSLDFHRDKDPNAYINIASCYGNLYKNKEAVDYYLKAFSLNPKLLLVPNLNHEFGFTYIQLGEFDKAREVFEKMLKADDDRKARGYRSLALLSMYRGKFSEATDQLHESILINKAFGSSLSELRDRLFLASIYKDRKMMTQYNEELNKVNELLKAEGMQAWWYFLYGKFLVRDGKIQRAERILHEISARMNKGNKSDTAAFTILKGEIELLKESRSEALDLIITGVRLRRDSYTLESLANYYYNTSDLDKAIATYKEIVEKKDFLGWEAQEPWIQAHYNLGRLCEKKGEYGQAVKYYREFLNIWKDGDTDIPMLADTKARLSNLKEWEE